MSFGHVRFLGINVAFISIYAITYVVVSTCSLSEGSMYASVSQSL